MIQILLISLQVLLLLLLLFVVFWVIPAFFLSYIIFSVLLVRNKPEKWGHGYSAPDDPEIVAIYDGGAAFREAHASARSSHFIHHDGLTLYGEYFDFGHDRAVIILAGRMECCIYACYFAEPYRAAGYNVLVIDGRAHGLSEGKYNCIGYKESGDLLAWGRYLHDERGVRSIVLHGVCIGASTCLFAMTDPTCPAYFTSLAVEGMYTSFYESTKNHMKQDGRPLFPVLYGVMFYIRLLIGADPIRDGPLHRIPRLDRPILFLHGRKDTYSLPAGAEKLVAACTAEKTLVWFDKGGHSRLRLHNTVEYDAAVTAYLSAREEIHLV